MGWLETPPRLPPRAGGLSPAPLGVPHLCKSPSLASKKFTVYLTDLAIKIRMSKVSWGKGGGLGVGALLARPEPPQSGSLTPAHRGGHSPPRAA